MPPGGGGAGGMRQARDGGKRHDPSYFVLTPVSVSEQHLLRLPQFVPIAAAGSTSQFFLRSQKQPHTHFRRHQPLLVRGPISDV